MSEAPGINRGPERGFAAQLPVAVAEWQNQGIITAEQAAAILENYPVEDAGSASRGRLVSILGTLGAVLIGLGVILFFAANWQELSKEVKLALMLVAVPAAYGAGYWARYRRQYLRAGTAVLLLAAVLYGAAIHLVAQAYHVPVNHPNLVLLWFLGVIPLAYVTRSQSVLTLGIVLFLAAVGFRGQEWLGDWDRIPFRAFPLYLALGLALYGLGKLQSEFRLTQVYAKPYELLGGVVALGAVYLLTFRFWWEEFFWESGIGGPPGPRETVEYWALVAVAVAVTVAGLAGSWLLRRWAGMGTGTLAWQGLAAAVFLVCAGLVVFLPAANDWVYPLLFNLLLLAGIVGLLFLGYFSGQEALINLALVFFSVDVFTRYFELSFDLLDRSLVFVVAGVILLAGGFALERGRRMMVGRLRSQEGGG